MKYKCNSYLDSYEYGKMSLIFTSKMWLNFSLYGSIYNVILCIIVFILSKNIVDSLGLFMIIEIIILILFRIRIRKVAKIFYKLYLKNKVDSNCELEFYDEYFIRKDRNTLEEKYSDISKCIETETNLYLYDANKDIIFIIIKNECELELINFVRSKFDNVDSRLSGNINFKNR